MPLCAVTPMAVNVPVYMRPSTTILCPCAVRLLRVACRAVMFHDGATCLSAPTRSLPESVCITSDETFCVRTRLRPVVSMTCPGLCRRAAMQLHHRCCTRGAAALDTVHAAVRASIVNAGIRRALSRERGYLPLCTRSLAQAYAQVCLAGTCVVSGCVQAPCVHGLCCSCSAMSLLSCLCRSEDVCRKCSEDVD